MLRTAHSKGDRLDIGGILKVCGQRNCLRNVPVLWTLTNDWSTAQPSVGLERKEAWWLNEKKIKIPTSWRRVGPEIKKRQYGLICIISLSWSSGWSPDISARCHWQIRLSLVKWHSRKKTQTVQERELYNHMQRYPLSKYLVSAFSHTFLYSSSGRSVRFM